MYECYVSLSVDNRSTTMIYSYFLLAILILEVWLNECDIRILDNFAIQLNLKQTSILVYTDISIEVVITCSNIIWIFCIRCFVILLYIICCWNKTPSLVCRCRWSCEYDCIKTILVILKLRILVDWSILQSLSVNITKRSLALIILTISKYI